MDVGKGSVEERRRGERKPGEERGRVSAITGLPILYQALAFRLVVADIASPVRRRGCPAIRGEEYVHHGHAGHLRRREVTNQHQRRPTND